MKRIGLLLVLLSGCAHVAPYDRGLVMSRVMQGPMGSLEPALDVHVDETREAMRGATEGGGASCGCN